MPGRIVTQSREAQVAVVARGDGNILHEEYTNAIRRLDMYIQNRIKAGENCNRAPLTIFRSATVIGPTPIGISASSLKTTAAREISTFR